MNNNYELLDSGDFQKLERFGKYVIFRPAPGAVWPKVHKKIWKNAHAVFERYADGKGEWTHVDPVLPESWPLQIGEFELLLRRTSFGHIGIFPEQQKNWMRLGEICNQNKDLKVLNLFAYTGGASMACALAGASVTHVDASKSTVQWAKENVEKNTGIEDKIRFIIEDVKSFRKRESRRGVKYNGIILDPPSFGRGTKNQIWKIEKDLNPLLSELKSIMSKNFKFLLLSSHSPGYSPISLENMLRFILPGNFQYQSEEMVLEGKNMRLPSGASAFAVRR
jgi:23S rRNA (cytosine1962-C5)-methyltransferase